MQGWLREADGAVGGAMELQTGDRGAPSPGRRREELRGRGRGERSSGSLLAARRQARSPRPARFDHFSAAGFH